GGRGGRGRGRGGEGGGGQDDRACAETPRRLKGELQREAPPRHAVERHGGELAERRLVTRERGRQAERGESLRRAVGGAGIGVHDRQWDVGEGTAESAKPRLRGAGRPARAVVRGP